VAPVGLLDGQEVIREVAGGPGRVLSQDEKMTKNLLTFFFRSIQLRFSMPVASMYLSGSTRVIRSPIERICIS
jgi:hypothetical protein